MKKKLAAILTVASLGALCIGLCACSDDNKLEEYFNNGNVITVRYDSSGGEILKSDSVALVDMFNPDKYQANSEGYVEIKLREPTDPKRPYSGKIGNTPISISRRGYYLLGWYETRTVHEETRINADGTEEKKPVDDDGNFLEYDELDAYYYYTVTNSKNEEERVIAVPRYEYKDYWNFETSRIKFKKGEKSLEKTLYAAWVKPFSFEYFYEKTTEGEWESYGTTEFNPAKAQSDESIKTAYLPDWSETTGKMEHKKNDSYTFPAVTGMTFDAAYKNAECALEDKITTGYVHGGTIDWATATVSNPVQNVYVKFKAGNYYRVSTAKQFADIKDPAGNYTILADELDFGYNGARKTNGEQNTEDANVVAWPSELTTNEFKGVIAGEGGKSVTFKNIGAVYNGTSGIGGLFGSVGDGATIENVTFENVYVDFKSARNMNGLSLGLFAGSISAEAAVTNVSVSGTISLWELSSSYESNIKVNLTANGEGREKVTAGAISVRICGAKRLSTDTKYSYYVHPVNSTLNTSTGAVTVALCSQSNKAEDVANRQFDEQFYNLLNNGGN